MLPISFTQPHADENEFTQPHQNMYHYIMPRHLTFVESSIAKGITNLQSYFSEYENTVQEAKWY